MNLEDIITKLDAKRHGENYRAKCPVHNGKHRNLWFKQADGAIYFECKKGCPYQAVRAALGLTGGEVIEGAEAPKHDPIKEAKRRRLIHEAWDRAKPIDLNLPTPAAHYLCRVRKVLDISTPVPDCLRESPEIKYYDEDFNFIDNFPAMMARLELPDGTLANVHRTYLTEFGQKAPVEKTKKLMASPFSGCTDGAAIKLFAPIEMQTDDDFCMTLGIAEGIETALACYRLFGVPTWAGWSASGIGKFVPPEEIKKLIIFLDSDITSRKYANQLNLRMREERVDLKVALMKPNILGEDFADQMLREIYA